MSCRPRKSRSKTDLCDIELNAIAASFGVNPKLPRDGYVTDVAQLAEILRVSARCSQDFNVFLSCVFASAVIQTEL